MTRSEKLTTLLTISTLRRRVIVLALCVCGACVCACVCVCVSVTTLAAVSLISTLKLNYEQLYHGILFIFNSWILLRLEVMVLFATPQVLYRLRLRGDITIALRNAGGHWSTFVLDPTLSRLQ